MTEWQKLEAKRRKLETEKRNLQTTLGEIALADSPTDEQRNESASAQERIIVINGELNTVETAIDGVPPEQRGVAARTVDNPHRVLFERASLAKTVGEAIEQRHGDGAEAELRAEFNIPGNCIHIEQLREVRAVTPAPANENASVNVIALPVFATGDSAYLGIDMPTVEAGQQNYTTIGSRPTVAGPHSDSTQAAEATAETWSGVNLGAERAQTAVQLRNVDLFNNPGADEAWRNVIAEALSEANDQHNIDELAGANGVARSAANAADTYKSVLSRFVYGPVDGREARAETDLRLLLGSETLADWGSLYIATGDTSAVAAVRAAAGGLRVSALIAALASSKQDVLIRRGTRLAMVNPIWSAVELIVDRTSRVREGETILNAIMYANRRVIRADGFARVQAQVA